MYRVLGRATSSNVQAVLWGLEELGVPYQREDYGETFGGLETAEFRAMNPHGKIPVLVTGAGAVFETAAILRFLGAVHGDEAFWPSDPAARARIDMWAEWAKHDVADGFTGPVFWRAVRMPAARRDPGAIAAAVQRLDRELAIADAVLAGQAFLCGDALSLADIMLGHVLYRYFDIEIARAEHPHLRAYADRLAQRPAYRAAVMVSYDSLRDTL